MAESARIKITWTTSTNAVSYKIYRSNSSNGPWTLLGSVPGYVGTWYDSSVDPSPFKDYYYQIVTTCTNGSTSVENVTVQCQNCPTENQASIFALRDTTYNTVITPEGPMPDNVAVQYYNALSDYLNTNNNANQSVLQTATARKGQNGNNRSLFCHKCGKEITDLKPNSPAPEFSYMSKQGNIASLLPTPPSAFGGSSTPQLSGQSWFADQNLGTFLQKKAPSGPFSFSDRWTFGIRDASQSSTFYAYDGGFVYSGASGPTNYPILTSGFQSYNYGGAQMVDASGNPLYESTGDLKFSYFNSIMVGKYANPTSFNVNNLTYQNFSTALDMIPSGASGNSNWYLAIVDLGDVWTNVNSSAPATRCILYLYKIIRRVPSWDYYVNGVQQAYGFELEPHVAPMFNFLDDSDPNTSWSVSTTNYFKNGNLRPNLSPPSSGVFTTDQNWAYLKFFQK